MPDKPASRGQRLKMPAVKVFAVENNIPCIQIEKFTDEIIEKIKSYNTDIGVVVSFGKIIPEKVFTLPKFGCFNVHFSLLPQYRGASPVQQALIDGQIKTGVTAFYIDKGLDSGHIIFQDSLDISGDDTACSLFDKLITL
jgi:methionyl-tRNA formyltransferase